MSLHGTYDDNNLFAKILRGEIPAVKVFEDVAVVAFMDIFPQTRGHFLVVPKGVKARNFLELPADKVAPLMERVHRLAIAADLSQSADRARLIAEIARQVGGVDVLVNNATSGSRPDTGLATTPEMWRRYPSEWA